MNALLRHLRAVARLLCFGIHTLLMYTLYLLSRVSWIAGRRRALRSKAACFRLWARGVAAIVGMRMRVRGQPPAAPFFMVSNHLSYMDVILLAAQADCFFVSKSEVASWPVMGFLARTMNTIFVDRERRSDVPRVIGLMREVLDRGHGVVFFPEGTSSNGQQLLRFRAALFEAPLRLDLPVYCVGLGYATPTGWPDAGLSVCWWGDMSFGDHFYGLLQLPWFEARLHFGHALAPRPDRIEFANAARERIERELVGLMAPIA